MTGETELGVGQESGLRRAIVLLLLDDRAQLRSSAELRAALPGNEPDELDVALAELELAGIVELEGEDVRVSEATRVLDSLNLIGI